MVIAPLLAVFGDHSQVGVINIIEFDDFPFHEPALVANPWELT